MIATCAWLWVVLLVSLTEASKELKSGQRKPNAPVFKPLDLSTISKDGLLGDWRIVQSPTLDVKGQHYYFLSSDYDLVSKQMQTGTWENTLNIMFKDLWEKRGESEQSSMVLDVGVNFGNFYLFAAAQGCHMLGFEMQPKLYNVVEMGIRLSGYKSHAHLVNTGVWFKKQQMTFTPVEWGPKQTNLGYTKLRGTGDGIVKINTSRIDSVLVNNKVGIFFTKIDVEEAEPQALLGMNTIFLAQRIHHFVIELKEPDILEVMYQIGYSCRMFDANKACLWPNIDPSCNMDTWASMLEYFKLHPADKIRKKYYDIHCELQANRVSQEAVLDLIKQASSAIANHNYVKYGSELFQVLKSDNDASYIVPVTSNLVPSASSIKEVTYTELFKLSMHPNNE